jgi:NADPH-dependent reductive aminase-like protein
MAALPDPQLLTIARQSGHLGASSMAHIVHTSEADGVDAGVMRAAEGMARRVIGLGHGTDGFIRIAEILGRR